MFVIVNGERTETRATSLPELLVELSHQGAHIAIAVNEEVVPRASWAKQALREGDAIEILTPRQGG
jgi:sulfur carrier protein